jgi:hypothetical protein
VKRKNPPHVHEYTNRHGRVVFYYRQPGRKQVRLRIADDVLPWSPTFMEAYEQAKSGGVPIRIGSGRTVPGTVNVLIVSYYASSSSRMG